MSTCMLSFEISTNSAQTKLKTLNELILVFALPRTTRVHPNSKMSMNEIQIGRELQEADHNLH